MFDCAVLIGRFQPVHKGHGFLIEQALLKAKKLVIVIGSSFAARSLRNPFSAQERKDMIIEVLLDLDKNSTLIKNNISKIINRVEFIFVKDYLYDDNDSLWQQDIIDKINKINKINNLNNLNSKKIVLIGHNKDETSYYLKHFDNWGYLELENFANINSTQIRNKFFAKQLFLPEGSAELAKLYHCTQAWLQSFTKSKNLSNSLSNSLSHQLSNRFEYLHQEYIDMLDYVKQWSGSPFPPIFVTCDALVICKDHVLMIERKLAPGKDLMALPGGFLEQKELIVDGVIRELYEETSLGIDNDQLLRCLQEVKVFDHPKRSSRGRVITNVGLFILQEKQLPSLSAQDDAKAAMWVPIKDLDSYCEQILGDHLQIINWFLAKYL